MGTEISEELFNVFDVSSDPNEDFVANINKKEAAGSVSVIRLFKYCNKIEIMLLLIGLFSSIGNGIMQPWIIFFWGKVVDNYSYSIISADLLDEEINHFIFNSVLKSTEAVVLKMLLFGLGAMLAGFLKTFCFFVLSQRQGIKLRKLYFKSLLRQDASWYDNQKCGELTSRISMDIKNFQDGLSFRFGTIFQTAAHVITGYIVSFVISWDLALIILATTPFSSFSMIIFGKLMMRYTIKGMGFFGESNVVAEETLGNIRTIKSLSQEQEQSNSYRNKMRSYDKHKSFSGHFLGIGLGVMLFFNISSFALGFWYGNLIVRGKGGSSGVTAGNSMTVFFITVMSSQVLSQISTPINIVSNAKMSAFRIFSTIKRIPDIDLRSTDGLKPEVCQGGIEFKSVHFAYPTRSNKRVLTGFDLKIEKGKTIAIVGASGCGKSTIIQILQRMYDPLDGSVEIDGINIKELNVQWLRNQIGLVGQEPVLFVGTIKENIQLGSIEGIHPTDEEIIECSKIANAHEFISAMPEGYNTIVGDRGSQISGGQKQRIAIARALIRNPRILLLDEATSALDSESEKIVQDALDKASQGRTTIIIAHRLSTIKNADEICVVEKGQIVEHGTHDKLLEIGGIYLDLIKKQPKDEIWANSSANKVDIKETNFEENQNRGCFENTSKETNFVAPKQKELKKHTSKFVLTRILWYQFKRNWLIFFVGTFWAIIAGGIYPFYNIKCCDSTIFLMKIQKMGDITQPEKDTMIKIIIWIVIIAVLGGLASWLYVGLLTVSGEHSFSFIRIEMFESMMKQEVGWFDREENKMGSLITKLSSEPNKLYGISGLILGNICCIIALIMFGLGLSLYFEWKVALSVMAVFPFLTAILFLDFKLNKMQSAPAESSYEMSAITLIEAVETMRTIQSLAKQNVFYSKFEEALKKPSKSLFRWALVLALINAATNFINYVINGYGFYVGTYLLGKKLNFDQPTNLFLDELLDGFLNLEKASINVVQVTQTVGGFGEFLPSVGKALKSAESCFEIIDARPISFGEEGKITLEQIKGNIEFKDVCFRYPTRTDIEVLKGISFKAEQGKTVAIVGASGCGKSTIIQILQRMYDPLDGSVEIDGINIKELNVQWLRNQIGLVGQEPVLFNESIMDNIRRGVTKGMEVSNEQIYGVCKIANAHEFISAMPEGYNTIVGDRGSQISGGQKQRIAIARALIRNPRILLLDEATSALDSESEKIVQDALDKASQGRTTIIIAHRLSTIKNADEICVVEKGQIVEHGTHDKLLESRLYYYNLVMKQIAD